MVNHPNRNKSKRKLTLGLKIHSGDVGPGTAKHAAVGWCLLSNWKSGVSRELPPNILKSPGKANVIIYNNDEDIGPWDAGLTARQHRSLVEQKANELIAIGWQIKFIEFDESDYIPWLGDRPDNQEHRSQWACDK